MNELTTTTELQKITTGLESFEQRKETLIELAESAKPLKIKDVEDKLTYKLISDKRKELKSARVLIEKEGKSMRDIITPVSKMISSKEKELVAIIIPEEERLQKEEVWFENELGQIKLEKERAEKQRIQDMIDALAKYNVAIDYHIIMTLSHEQFNEKLSVAKSEFEAEQKRIAEELARVEEERQAEIARLENQRKEQEAERIRLENIAAEQRKVQEKIDAAQKAIDDEKNRIAKEKQDAIDAENRAKEIEEAKKQAAENALKEAEEKRIRDEKVKIESERIAKEKEEKRIARMPDKKKLEEFAESISKLVSPDLKSIEADAVLSEAVKQLNKVQNFILQSLESL